jgi:hypothetical protein
MLKNWSAGFNPHCKISNVLSIRVLIRMNKTRTGVRVLTRTVKSFNVLSLRVLTRMNKTRTGVRVLTRTVKYLMFYPFVF